LHVVETPTGLFSAAGFWYRTSFASIDHLAPGLRAKIDLHQTVRDTEVWIRSFESVGLWTLLLSLPFLGAYPSALLATVLSLIWYFWRSALIHPGATSVVKALTHDGPVLIATLFVISYVGNSGRTLDAILGLAFFFVFRFGWLRMLLDRWHDAARPMSMNDRILRMMLIREAMRHDIRVESVHTMQTELMKAVRKSSLTRK
jgi:hypothetical protein